MGIEQIEILENESQVLIAEAADLIGTHGTDFLAVDIYFAGGRQIDRRNIIDKSGFTDLEIYKKAHIDRRLFSKIKSDVNYHPSFGTISLLALSLTLSIENYELLLKSASYSLSTNNIHNIVLRYCFEHKLYDIFYVNNLLYTITDKEIKDL